MTMPTQQNGKKIKFYSLIALAFSAVAIVLRTSCLVWFYDRDIGYYTKDILPALLEVLCVLAVAFFGGIFFVLKPCDKTSDGKENNLALKVSSALAAVAFVSFFVFSVTSTSLVTGIVAFDLTSKISALVSIVYFAMNLFAPHINRAAQTALGFGIIIWSICTLAITYFDIYVQLNSPEKIILHLALVSCMAFFVSEFRCFVSGVKSKIYLFTVFCAVFFSGTCSIPFILAYLLGAINSGKYLFYNIVLFSLFIYSVARMLSFCLTPLACADENDASEEAVQKN